MNLNKRNHHRNTVFQIIFFGSYELMPRGLHLFLLIDAAVPVVVCLLSSLFVERKRNKKKTNDPFLNGM